MDKILVATRIDGQTHRILRDIGQREDRTVAYLLRKAVERYVEGQEGQRAVKRDAAQN